MAEESSQPQIEPCPTCGGLVDVSEQEVFALAHCPMCGTAMRVRRYFNHFELLEVIGAGGMGTVYKALDTKLNRNIAIKVLKSEYGIDPELVRKLEREARITASINHPNVVKVFSFGSAQGQYFLAMELVEKGSLDDLMLIQNRVAEMQILQVGIQIALGLDAAYQRGLIHSDVKPGNILFADAQTAKIVDFGLAELMEEEAEKKGEVWGTPYYVSPERLNHEPEDFRSDLYSLGGTLFHALAGRPPFEAENASLVALKHVRSKAVSLQAFAPDISSETAYVINRMLKKDPEERYGSYAELVEHLTYAKTKMEERIAAPRRQKERVVVEGEGMKTFMGWLTLLGILAFALVVTLVVLNRDRLFAPPGDDDSPRRIPRGSTQAVAPSGERYLAARKRLIDGEIAGALAEFRAIRESGPLIQPLKNWTQLMEGLCLLLGGKTDESRAAFEELNKVGMYSMDPSQQLQANFFVEVGRLLSTADRIPRATARLYSKENVEVLAIFLFALKNWQLGFVEDAIPLFREFLLAEPAKPWGWISELKPKAESYISEVGRLEKAIAAIESASTVEQFTDAAKELDAAESALRENPRIRPALTRLRTRLNQSLYALTPAPTPTPTPTPSLEDAQKEVDKVNKERASFDALAARVRSLLVGWRFGDARGLAEEFAPEDAAVAKDATGLLSEIAWLERFQALMIEDINHGGYPGELRSRSGARLQGGASKANLEQVEVVVPYGTMPLRWTDMPPDVVVGIAQHFWETGADPEKKADLQWGAGVFLHLSGEPDAAREFLLEASRIKNEYRDALDVFFGPR